MVDGCTLLKWILVARGRSEADAVLRRVGRGMVILEVILGTCVIVQQLTRHSANAAEG
jgi:hypothetical protein